MIIPSPRKMASGNKFRIIIIMMQLTFDICCIRIVGWSGSTKASSYSILKFEDFETHFRIKLWKTLKIPWGTPNSWAAVWGASWILHHFIRKWVSKSSNFSPAPSPKRSTLVTVSIGSRNASFERPHESIYFKLYIFRCLRSFCVFKTTIF
jgi:hypothetical protein